MNNQRRKALAEIGDSLTEIMPALEEHLDALRSIQEEEEEAYDNMPEGLQMGERGEMSQAAIEAMSEALDALDNFITASVQDAIERAAE